MHRRTLLTQTALAGLAAMVAPGCAARAPASGPVGGPLRRVRPSDPEWPDAAAWSGSASAPGAGSSGCSRRSPSACARARRRPARRSSRQVKNPYYLGDEVGADADARLGRRVDVRAERLRGRGAHTPRTSSRRSTSRASTSCGWSSRAAATATRAPPTRRTRCWSGRAAWTRSPLHDAFVPAGCAGRTRRSRRSRSGPARSGRRSTTPSRRRRGRYVQGGGCMTVGVAGLVQSGGFGSFSKAYGRPRPACWRPRSSPPTARCASPTPARTRTCSGALKGGGGGSLGVVTRLTLRTHDAARELRRG